MIQISSKSCLSTWSGTSLRPKSHSATDRALDDLFFASKNRPKLGRGLLSFSDPCLAKRVLEDSEQFKIASSSAPQSCSGSSGSEVEDDDSGDTDEMEHFDPSVKNSGQGKNVGQKLGKGACVNGDVLSEDKIENDKIENENSEFGLRKKELQEESCSDQLETSMECGFVVGDDTEESVDDVVGANDQEVYAAGEEDKKEREKEVYQNGRDKGSSINQITNGESEEVHSNGQSDTSERGSKNGETDSLQTQENRNLNCNELSVRFKENDEVHQISFHGTTASMRVSHSSVELGTMAAARESENRDDKSPERRRFGARFPGNRGLKLFATAQARGRTLIPELRNKLSSFSQQVRSRSPRSSAKRPGLHTEPNTEQRKLRRRCRTKIIEL